MSYRGVDLKILWETLGGINESTSGTKRRHNMTTPRMDGLG